MKSLEVQLNETIAKLSPTQVEKFYSARSVMKTRDGATPTIEVQLNLAESLRKVTKNNGSNLSESAPVMTSIQERQVASYKRSGMTQAEAEVCAGVHDRAIRIGVQQGKSVAQVVESLRQR